MSKHGRSDRRISEDYLPLAPLSDYTLGDCLGRGAFGSVYRALNWGTGETVAVKQIRLADLPKSELRMIMACWSEFHSHHPNIVQYHGCVKSSDSLYIILDICKNFGKFPENLVGLYTTQVLHGLLYLHDQGVIHRDIKGANILTTKEGLIKLADFGVATRTTGLSDSSVVGSPYWMAPEVIELVGATTASDIWSVGCTIIELLEGKPPYHDLAPMPALFRIVNDDHPPIPDGSSPAVKDFLVQCFQKDPYLRVSARKLLKHPWILNTRRSDPVLKTSTTRYDDAVRSVQQWNEALKNPRDDEHKGLTSPQSQIEPPWSRLNTTVHEPTSTIVKNVSIQSKTRQFPETFASLQDSVEDNWDSDFATSISSSALELSHLKPYDHFDGQLSSDNLKRLAISSADETSKGEDFLRKFEENNGSSFYGDNIDSSRYELDPLLTIRPTPRRTWTDLRGFADESASLESRSVPKSLLDPGGLSSQISSSVGTGFKSGSYEDDLQYWSAEEEISKPRRTRKRTSLERSGLTKSRGFNQAESKFSTQVKLSGTSRSRDDAVSSVENSFTQNPALFEIERFAETDDEDDFSDIFGNEQAQPSTGQNDSAERGSFVLNTRLSSDSWVGDDEVEDDDPFAELEEGFAEMDLDANIARDKHARLCIQVEDLVSSLKTGYQEDDLMDVACQLLDITISSPETKSTLIGAHGLLPILEILDSCHKNDLILKLLKLVNSVIFDDVDTQENLCFVGGIRTISKYAAKTYPQSIRLEAATFIQQIYQMSTLTLQMFVSCGGLSLLVEFVKEDYITQKDLVLVGINGIWNVFELQGSTQRNDFCRIFSRSSILHPLSLVLGHILDEKGEEVTFFSRRIVNIFYLFSQAENLVKEAIADRTVLNRIVTNMSRLQSSEQITLLKFFKNLSMLSSTLDKLQDARLIQVLAEMLRANMNLIHFKEMSNQILNTMYNLCRLSKPRQELAAANGIIPILQRIVGSDRPLKEFALPILCDIAHSGKAGRNYLWQNKGLDFFVNLLSDPYWQVNALDAIFVWLQDEPTRIEGKLLDESRMSALVKCFTSSKANAFENLLEPLQKLLRLSLLIAGAIGRPQVYQRILQKLTYNKPVVRVNLLRILRSLCDASMERENVILVNGLLPTIQWLSENDGAVLVRNMAMDFVKSVNGDSTGKTMTLNKAAAQDLPPTRSSSSGINQETMKFTPSKSGHQRRYSRKKIPTRDIH